MNRWVRGWRSARRNTLAVSLFTGGLAAVVAAGCSATGGEREESTGTSRQAAAAVDAPCDLSGTWAIRFDFTATWPQTFVIQGGSGPIRLYAKSEQTVSGATLTSNMQTCGASLPDYYGTPVFGGEHYGIRFPDSLFDARAVGTATATATTSREPGSSFTFSTTAPLLGLTLASPTTTPWPSTPNQVSQVDADADGKVGITLSGATGGDFRNLPLNSARSARADRAYAAIRLAVTPTLTVTSCTELRGTATVPVINNKPAIDSRILGCRTEAGADCTSSQYGLLDAAQPVFTPSGAATVVFKKVAAGATCAAVRATAF